MEDLNNIKTEDEISCLRRELKTAQREIERMRMIIRHYEKLAKIVYIAVEELIHVN